MILLCQQRKETDDDRIKVLIWWHYDKSFLGTFL